jgi:hypothetical protein
MIIATAARSEAAQRNQNAAKNPLPRSRIEDRQNDEFLYAWFAPAQLRREKIQQINILTLMVQILLATKALSSTHH